MIKEELITEITTVTKMGLSEDKGGNENVDIYLSNLLDDYVYDQNIRLRADFENYKKRVGRERGQLKTQIKFETLSEFLNILDDWTFFEEVVSKSNNNDIKTGFSLIDRKIKSFLSDSKIEVIDTSIKFNSDLHESVSILDEGKESGDILNVISMGYKIGDTVIKYPKVIVQK